MRHGGWPSIAVGSRARRARGRRRPTRPSARSRRRRRSACQSCRSSPSRCWRNASCRPHSGPARLVPAKRPVVRWPRRSGRSVASRSGADGRWSCHPASPRSWSSCSRSRAAGATDEAIEALWPEVEEESGRKRLRNVLNRLRDGAGELVVRDGESLTFANEDELDAERFEAEARRALAAPAAERPRRRPRRSSHGIAASCCPMTATPRGRPVARERLHRRHRALLDLLVVDAEQRGDLDEALRLLDRTIESDPYDETGYLAACRLLLAQGRRAAATQMLAGRGRSWTSSRSPTRPRRSACNASWPAESRAAASDEWSPAPSPATHALRAKQAEGLRRTRIRGTPVGRRCPTIRA